MSAFFFLRLFRREGHGEWMNLLQGFHSVLRGQPFLLLLDLLLPADQHQQKDKLEQ